jgi:class 3 adenylate cyclase
MSNLTVSQPRVTAQSEFRVLVVDDDQEMARYLAHMPRREVMQADTAADGNVALARVVASPPDLVMLDVLMRDRRIGIATGMGIGVCRGEAIIGNIGSPHYMSYTIIGHPVNTAARLMQMAAANEVLVCGPFYESVREFVPEQDVRSRGNVALRGRSEPTSVFCIAGSRPEV